MVWGRGKRGKWVVKVTGERTGRDGRHCAGLGYVDVHDDAYAERFSVLCI